MKEIILGLGTNIGNRTENLQNAVHALRHLPNTSVTAISHVYETAPWGYTEQADFYNICVRLESELSPEVILGSCLGIEAAMGRERPFKNSPRVIDIDLLLYENYEKNTPELTVPHKEIQNRAFVLYPLKEVLEKSRLDFSTEPAILKVKDQRIRKTDISIY